MLQTDDGFRHGDVHEWRFGDEETADLIIVGKLNHAPKRS